jgi:flagellar biosynthesis protein FlhF
MEEETAEQRKVFRAPSMLEALQAVQQELGPDALVLSMRQVPAGPSWQMWRDPLFEVIAAPPAAPQVEADAAQGKEAAGPQPRSASGPDGAATKARSKASVAPPKVQPIVFNTSFAYREAGLSSSAKAANPVQRMKQWLLHQEVNAQLVEKMTALCSQALPEPALTQAERVESFFRSQLEANLKPSSAVLLAPTKKTLFLVGLSGSGKTSTCAKLAAFYAYEQGKKVAWVATDTFRTGAIAEARFYAESLRIPFAVAYTPQELYQATLDQPADLFLVDTPGCNPHEEKSLETLGELLSAVPEREVYLTAAATTKEDDLEQAFAGLEAFSVRACVLTKMDESDTFGQLYNFVWRHQLPVAFYVTGQDALGSLQIGGPRPLVKALFQGGTH